MNASNAPNALNALDVSNAATLALPLVLLATAACGSAPPHVPTTPHGLVGQEAPDFRRDTLDGKVFKLADFKGKVVVVKFAANYCEPCKKTLPALESYHQKAPDVAILVVAEDERLADARALVQSTHITMPVVLDGSNILSSRFRVPDLPSTYIVGKDQRVRWMGGPERTEDDLIRAIEEARAATIP